MPAGDGASRNEAGVNTWQQWFRAAVVGLLLIGSTGCERTVSLYSKLVEKDANEMMAVLLRASIPCAKEAGEENTWNLMVPDRQFADAMELLQQMGFPRDQFRGVSEVFKKSGMVSTPSEEHIRFMTAKSEDIAEMLTRIDGVLTARVNIVLPDNDPFAQSRLPSSASVFIKHRHNANVTPYISQIKNLVVNSIEGLTYEKVTVVLFPAEPPAMEVEAARAAVEEPVTLMSVKVARETVANFWMLVGGLAVLVVLAAAISAFLYHRLRTAIRSPAQA
jgi:type III secretion protein J